MFRKPHVTPELGVFGGVGSFAVLTRIRCVFPYPFREHTKKILTRKTRHRSLGDVVTKPTSLPKVSDVSSTDPSVFHRPVKMVSAFRSRSFQVKGFLPTTNPRDGGSGVVVRAETLTATHYPPTRQHLN